ncbi:NAD(P)/FAD-dependent oxidoreductase [Actinoplanes sp. NPDC051851]|uniref:flavin-containing monooxygenase n=1 Tax=Actinoplanes sp. NPDC051851 TaxID=3154753 RepID=UPI0034127F94
MTTEVFDILIIGAGLSGIGVAASLRRDRPRTTIAILESRAAIGGTWDLFRYPGIRSDSDLYTFAYEFKPWLDKRAIAPASSILDYLKDTIIEYDLSGSIHLDHHVRNASWSTADRHWTVTADTGESSTEFRSRWLFIATGYYDYTAGYTPDLPGVETFGGQVVHPQAWPEDLDPTGRDIVVIGSGATAVTLVPALAPDAAHVTMLQRTPTYILPLPSGDPIADLGKRILGPRRGHAFARWKNLVQNRAVYQLSRRFPQAVRKVIRAITVRSLPAGYPVDVHFNPPYDPWDQRLCLVPDGDLFKAISNGSASVVTDRIATFTPGGIRLESGAELAADIVVTATGLNLLPLGGIRLTVDGRPIDITERVAFRGMLLSGLPNTAFAIGYTTISWTLKIGLVAQHLARLMDEMDTHGFDMVVPELPDGDFPTRPLLDFEAGYIQRAISRLPKQGMAAPWLMPMDYRTDAKTFRHGTIRDRHLRFEPTSDTQRQHPGGKPETAAPSD